jgi:hypothetical protein
MNPRLRLFSSLLAFTLLVGCATQREQLAYRLIDDNFDHGVYVERPEAGPRSASIL